MQSNWLRTVTNRLQEELFWLTENMKTWLFGLFFLGSLSIIGSAFLVWGYEGYYFLKYGMAIDFTVIALAREYYCPTGVCAQDAFQLWLYYPTDWVGLHSALSHIDVGFLLLGVGFLILYLMGQLPHDVEHPSAT